MSDETPVEQPGGRMTRDDLVRRLTHVAGELHDCPMCEPHAETVEAAAAALVAPPAAPPADLVALVREWQEAVRNVTATDDVSAGEVRIQRARRALLAYPLPAAPRVPDTPCKHCGGSGKYSGPPLYDPSFGDEEVCACGHHYYRHFDSYDEMAPVGCKYCECMTYAAPPQEPPR